MIPICVKMEGNVKRSLDHITVYVRQVTQGHTVKKVGSVPPSNLHYYDVFLFQQSENTCHRIGLTFWYSCLDILNMNK